MSAKRLPNRRFIQRLSLLNNIWKKVFVISEVPGLCHEGPGLKGDRIITACYEREDVRWIM